MKQLLHAGDQERAAKKKQQASELKKAEKRKAEVDRIFIRIYEDWSAERIDKDNFNMLSEKFQGEQKELNEKIRQLREAMENAAQTAADAEKWVELMKQYVNTTELSAELLNTLIEKIVVHEAVVVSRRLRFSIASSARSIKITDTSAFANGHRHS